MTTLSLAEAEATLSQHIGTTGALVTKKIEAGAVQRFVEAIGDPNPMFVDRETLRARGGTASSPHRRSCAPCLRLWTCRR